MQDCDNNDNLFDFHNTLHSKMVMMFFAKLYMIIAVIVSTIVIIDEIFFENNTDSEELILIWLWSIPTWPIAVYLFLKGEKW